MRTKYVTLAVATFLFLAASQIGIVQGESAYISNVPYHKQEQGYWCGPAVLQMMLEFWGISQTQTEIAAVVYDADDKVTTMFALKNYTRNLGFNNTAITGNITQLKAYINEGLPAIVLQKISTTNAYGHYRVVVGYDDRNGVFITNDP